MMIVYHTDNKGICTKKITVNIDEDIIIDIQFDGGCKGNLLFISNMFTGMHVDTALEIINANATTCGNKKTSCVSELGKAIELYKDCTE